MLGHVDLVRTDVSEERIGSITRVTRIGLLVIANIVSSMPILVALMMESIHSSEK
jgi:hypothetical protein